MRLQVRELSVLNFVSLWIVLGIGSDDIFVFHDAWTRSAALRLPPPPAAGDAEGEGAQGADGEGSMRSNALAWLPGAGGDGRAGKPGKAPALDPAEAAAERLVQQLALRLSWSVREAGSAMLVTTATTASAFFGTAVTNP